MALQFIDNAVLDRDAMRLVRSHAAKGRNLGRGRPRKNALAKHEDLVEDITLQARGQSKLCSVRNHPEVPIYDGLSLLPLAWELRPATRNRLRKLIDYFTIGLWPSYLREAINQNMSHPMWVHFIFQDEAYFFASVALLNSFFGFAILGAADSQESIEHYDRTLCLINQKLSGVQATDPSSFATVVLLTQLHRLSGDFVQGMVHLDGLKIMADLCGGLEMLSIKHAYVAQKLFRADLDFAMHLGIPTRFSLDSYPTAHVIHFLKSAKCSRPSIPSELMSSTQLSLQRPFTMATRLSHIVNAALHSSDKLDSSTVHETAIMLGYLLVEICPFSALPLEDPSINTLFVGLCAFVLAFLPSLNGAHASVPMLTKAARTALQADEGKLVKQDARLWSLLTCRATLLVEEDDVWILPMIAQSMHTLQLTAASNIALTHSDYPWLDTLHDNIYTELSNKACIRLDTPTKVD